MISGNINYIDETGAYPPAVLHALRLLQQYDFSKMEPGRYEVEGGDDIYLLVCELNTEPAADRKLEAHRRYIDIHLVLQGSENIGFCVLGDDSEIESPYDEKNDIVFFKNNLVASLHRLLPGDFAVFFPRDLHRTLCCDERPAPVRKVLMKVSCSLIRDDIASKTSIRWGMIGTGDVTEIKSGPALYKSAGSSLLGVYNRTLAKAQDYARRHNVNKVYSSADDLINDRVIDAVYIATPPDSHLDYARKVIAAGKPVYIEKPLAPTGAECRQIALSAAQAQVPVFTAFYRRGLSRFQKVKELLNNNSLGKLKEVKISFSQPLPIDALQNKLPWRLDSSISSSGMFLDVAIHAIDILDFLLGPISVVSSIAKSLSGISETIDTVTAHWKHPLGVRGYGEWSFCADESHDMLTISGDCGEITLSVFGNSPIRFITPDQTENYTFPVQKHVEQPYIQAIVNELLGKGSHPGSLESAIRAVEVIEKMSGF